MDHTEEYERQLEFERRLEQRLERSSDKLYLRRRRLLIRLATLALLCVAALLVGTVILIPLTFLL